jgi:hypothetical protein
MTINTKFNAGDQVYFLEGGSIYLRPIQRITIEMKASGWKVNDPSAGVSTFDPLITYYFVLYPNVNGCKEIYKYESELGLSKEELMNTLQVL